MFSNEGLPDLADPRGRGFHHSLMSSFSERPDCTLCSYMWNENLVAVWHVEPLMGLRELPRRYKIDPTTSTVVFKILHIEPPEVRSFASFAIWVVSPEGRLRWGPREEFILAASEGRLRCLDLLYSPLIFHMLIHDTHFQAIHSLNTQTGGPSGGKGSLRNSWRR